MSAPSIHSCGYTRECSLTETLESNSNVRINLADLYQQLGLTSRFRQLRAFLVRYNFGQIILDNSFKFITAPYCSLGRGACSTCQKLLAACADRDTLVVIGSKTAELFLQRSFGISEISGNFSTTPLHVFRPGDAFTTSHLSNTLRRPIGDYEGFRFALTAGARTAAVSIPVRDVRLARTIRKRLPKSLSREFINRSDEQIALAMARDNGLLLRLLATTHGDIYPDNSWSCEILIVPLPTTVE